MTKAPKTLRRGAVAATLVAAAISASLAFGAEPPWRPLAAAPRPRQEVTYAALDDQVYLAAGNSVEQDRYDPTSDTWTKVASLPAGFADLDHVGATAVDGKLIYAGGLTKWEYPFPVSGEVATYDPVTDAFASGADMPSPRAAGGVAAWHGKLIYAGGLGPEGSVARVDAYDPRTDEWTRLADMPRPRDHFQAVVVGDELYAIGGRRTFEGSGIEIEDVAPVDELELPADDADLASATWKPAVTSIPTPRGGLGVAAVGACVYAIGGERTTGGSGTVTGATESYDTVSGEWRELPPLAIPRHGIQAATVGQTIYVAAGGTKSFDYVPTAAHEALDVSAAAPCVAVEREEPEPEPEGEPEPEPEGEPEPEPEPEPRPEPEGPPAPGTDPHGTHPEATLVLSRAIAPRPPLIASLTVRPRRVQVEDRHPRPKIVIRLSTAGEVSIRLPGRVHFVRWLPAGRDVLRLPVGPHHRLLPRGRYLLEAAPDPSVRGDLPVSAWFEVIR